jgi:chromate transport protein ChrA
VTAAVVGLIAVTTVPLALMALPNWAALAIFVVVLPLVYRWKSKLAVPILMVGAGLAGALIF